MILLKCHSLVIRWSDIKTNKLDKTHTYYILEHIYVIQPTHAFVPAVIREKSKMKIKAYAQELYTHSHNTGSRSDWIQPSQQTHIKQALSIF